MSKQETGVEQETFETWVRNKGIPSAAAEALAVPSANARPDDTPFLWFRTSMHFGSYLTIAALVLMGLEVIYALYQLAAFVL